MASPQLENGAISIAYDLYTAILASTFKQIELKVIYAVMYLTYGSGKTKSQISTVDIRYLLGATESVRSDRIDEALESLVRRNVLFRHTINQSQQVLGIQKDFEKWVLEGGTSLKSDKMSESINRVNTNTSTIESDKLSVLTRYAHQNTSFHYSIPTYRVELKHARLLYKEALQLTRDPVKALQAIKDYVDDLNSQEWFKGCKMRLIYMSSRFRQWYGSIPIKPKSVRDQEEITGYKFRWNLLAKDWEKTDAKR